MNFTVGARGSKLSIAQTDWVISELQKTDSSLSFDIKPITTKGDTDTRPLFAMEQKGIFEKEIDRAVFEKEVDFAVHSLKDVPSQLDPNLIISCIPKREAVNDVLITRDGFDIEEIPSGSVIGSSSLRRAVQVTRKRPDVIVKPVRGNIETRIKKVEEGKFDGIVLAQAGITRLGTDIKISKLPNSVDSGCRFPVGAVATSDANSLTLKVAVYSMDGKKSIILEKTGSIEEPHALGRLLGDELRDRGVKEIASNWREELEEWNKQ